MGIGTINLGVKLNIFIFLFFISIPLYGEQHRELNPRHPFSSIHSFEDFSAWCRSEDLNEYASYFKNRSWPELHEFLQLTQRILHPHLTRTLQIDSPVRVLKTALESEFVDVGRAIGRIEDRFKEDLKIYHPLQRAFYDYALGTDAKLYSDKILNLQGRIQIVLKIWSLPIESIDRDFFEASYANSIIQMDPSLIIFSPDEKNRILSLSSKFHHIVKERYSDENKWLRTIRFKELKLSPTPNQGSIDDFIQEFAFADTNWWMISSGKVSGETTAATDLRGDRSKSLLRRLGPKATRIIYWPLENKSINAKPVLGKLHIAVNLDAEKRMRSIEVLAKGPDGKVHPFMYEKVLVGHREAWLPVRSLNGRTPIVKTCSACHANGGEIQFRPQFLETEKDFTEDGYKSPFIITELKKL